MEGPLPLCTKPGTMGGREESTHTQWVGRGVEVEVGGCGGCWMDGGCETVDVGRLLTDSSEGGGGRGDGLEVQEKCC